MRQLIFLLVLVSLASSCRKTVGPDYQADLIGEWVSISDTSLTIVINENGSGYDNGRYARNVYVKTNRDKLIFRRTKGKFSSQAVSSGSPRTTYFIKIHPTVAIDTIFLDGLKILPGETYMKLVDEHEGAIDFAERYYIKQ